ncbi:MAG: histidine phosphatase family protein [Candidatus Paceibacterota bacterium]|jgi:broad specificity phosphatase PhoE
MGWPSLLVLVRHAESEGNLRTANERAEYGVPTHEYALSARGEEQAKITGEYLKKRFDPFDIHYVSYYKRSRSTMGIMYPDIVPYEDPRLAEAQRGIWHTMTEAQIRARFPEEFVRKERENVYQYRPFGGENWPDVELRIHSFLGTLSRDYSGKKVVIVVHGHWLILFQRLVHHFSIEEAIKKYKSTIFGNASITVYRGEDNNGHSRLVLEEENIVPWKGVL